MELFDLHGKIALVTGATQGLGLAMATGLGKAGATLIANGRSSQDKLDAALEHYRDIGIRINELHRHPCAVVNTAIGVQFGVDALGMEQGLGPAGQDRFTRRWIGDVIEFGFEAKKIMDRLRPIHTT